jgi:hypothetical protein
MGFCLRECTARSSSVAAALSGDLIHALASTTIPISFLFPNSSSCLRDKQIGFRRQAMQNTFGGSDSSARASSKLKPGYHGPTRLELGLFAQMR